jgi:exopolysaccharide production protein ExoY
VIEMQTHLEETAPQTPTRNSAACRPGSPLEWPHLDRRGSNATARQRPHAMYGRRESDQIKLPTFPRSGLVARRALDLAGATVGLVLLAPLMLVVALLVKLTSRGPVFFRQTRVGRNHEHFTMVKFRTMADGTYEQLKSDPTLWVQYVANDFKLPGSHSMITPLGRVLRKTSLDELPQLFNVLCGHMSLIGIRPLVPAELAERPRPSQGLYGAMRPGLTGLWQTEGRSNVKEDERLELDDRYVREWALRRDVLILLKTPVAVLRSDETS